MKFLCERDALLEALSNAGRAVSNRGNSVTALSGIRAELNGDQLTLTGTDLDLTISVQIEVMGEVDGVVVLPAKLTSDIVRALGEGRVEITVEDEEARIVSGPANFTILLLPPEGFPTQAHADTEPVTIPAKSFADAIKMVVRAASRDETRSVALNGVMLEAEANGLRLVATDSYRLAIADLPGFSLLGEQSQVIVPARALQELIRLTSASSDELEVHFEESFATFRLGTTEVITRLISADYPNYKGLIPTTNERSLKVDRDSFVESVRRVALMVQSTQTPIRISCDTGNVELRAVTPDRGEAREALEAEYEGEELLVAFNPEYLLDGLDAISGEQVQLSLIDNVRPAVLREAESDEFTYVLMPVRIS
ncbi:MAG: DNA polymerase III subunit beta [Acidimicrobiia bacterium]